MSNLPVDESDPRFQVPVDKVLLFYTNKNDELFKITVKSHKNDNIKISHTGWGPSLDERVCTRSTWVYPQFSSLLSNTKTIPCDIAARIDEINLTGEPETISNSAEGSLCASKKNPIELPDLETNSKKQIPTLWYITVKFRLSWLNIFTKVIDGCVSKPSCTEDRKNLFAIKICILR